MNQENNQSKTINYVVYEYRIRNAIIKANSPVAADRVKPKKAYWNNGGRRAGIREVAVINPENTNPIPTPAPANPIVANPAPIFLAACSISFFVVASYRFL